MIYVAEGALRKLISPEDKRDGSSSWLWNPFSTPLYFHELVWLKHALTAAPPQVQMASR